MPATAAGLPRIELASAAWLPAGQWDGVSEAVRRRYLGRVAELAVLRKRYELRLGIGANGGKLAAVKPRHDGATGKPLDPHYGESRSVANLRSSIGQAKGTVTLWWTGRVKRVGFGQILLYHAQGLVRGAPARDVIGLSPAGQKKVTEEARRFWRAINPQSAIRNPQSGGPAPIPAVVRVHKGRTVPPKPVKVPAAAKPVRSPKPPPTPKPVPKPIIVPPPVVVRPPPKPFGPSMAPVTIDSGHTEAGILRTGKAIFGRDVTLQDLASVAGAPDDAQVEILASREGELIVYLNGTGYQAERRIRKLADGKIRLLNESFILEATAQGKGLGTRVLGRQIESAVRLGVSDMRTEASGQQGGELVGYSVWPKFGYDGKLPNTVQQAIDFGEVPVPPTRKPSHEIQLSDLQATPEGRVWWDTHGQTVTLTFDLSDGSYSRQAWDEYRTQKAASPK